MRIVLTAEDFKTLVSGGTVDKDTVKIILQDIGWGVMLNSIQVASGGSCRHPKKYLVSGAFGGYWCDDCDRNVDEDLKN